MFKKTLPFLVIIVVLSALFFLLSKKPHLDLIFYYGDSCPHCKNVEDWLAENNSEEKIKVDYKEVYDTDSNRNELYRTVSEYCPELITESGSIGVPTAFDPVNQKCIQGDTPIIEFLSSKLTE